MDRLSNMSEAVPHGHVYGNTSADGHATVVVGDVYLNNRETDEAAKRENQRQVLHAALSYDGMHLRSEQLSLPQIPLQSFAWIWETPFSSWASGTDPFFWISGKPGSGKSTLMQHLAKSGRTFGNLNEGGGSYYILQFFFDYRAGSMTANDPIGVLKMFLSQLCACSEELEHKLAEKNARASVATAGINSLLDLLAEACRLLGNEVCAFIDGLDEYHGHYTDLGDVLAQIQDRTGMKMCVASRPEPSFQDLFKGRPSIRMQDHNAASVRAYINHAIRKGRENMAQVDMVFTKSMREQLQRRAQGVIIWARLAVDELLRAAYNHVPRETLEDILEHLPEELEEMYERCITRMRHTNTVEVSLTLFLLNGLGGSIGIGVLFGLWHFFCPRIPGCPVPSNNITQEEFLERLVALIGSLIDVLTKSAEVRLIHKTLQPYLRRSAQVQDQLPQDFRARYEHHFELKIYADIVEAATTDCTATLDEVLIGLQWAKSVSRKHHLESLLQSADFVFNCLQSIPSLLPVWKTRIKLLSWSILCFAKQAELLECNGVSSYQLGKRAMSSCLLIAAFEKPLWGFSTWHRAQRCEFIDLVIALHHGLRKYVEDRLADELLLNERDWCELLRKTLLLHGADAYLLDLLKPHCKIIQSDLLQTCVTISGHEHRFRRDMSTALARMLSEMKLLPPVRKDPLFCENDSCGTGDDLVHWWTLRCGGDKVSKTILHRILESGESINTRCKQNGTALHILVSKCIEVHYSLNCPLWKLMLLARLNIDPMIKHKDQTPLQLATQLKLAASSRSWVPFTREPSHVGDLDFLIQTLTYYEKNRRWPEWIVPHQPQHALASVHEEIWQTEAGRIILADLADSDTQAQQVYSFHPCCRYR